MNQPFSIPPSAGSANTNNLHNNTLDSLKTRLLQLIHSRDTTRETHLERVTREKQRQQHLLRENERLMKELRALREIKPHFVDSLPVEDTNTLHKQDEVSLLSDDSSFNLFHSDTLQHDDLHIPTALPTLIPGAPSSNLKRTHKKKKKKDKGQQLRLPTTFLPSTRTDYSIAHGDICIKEKDDASIRLILLNPGGLTGDEGGKFLDLATQFKLYNTDILFAPEPKLNPHSDYAKNCKALFEERYVRNGIMTLTNTKLPEPSSYPIQAGGVATFISPTLARKHNCTERDKYGRWHSHTFFFKNKLFKTYCVYRVCTDSDKCENNAYKHQQFQLNLAGIETCPRRQIIYDLKVQLEEDLKRGIDIGVFADTNESRVHPTKHFISMMKDLGFHDVLVDRLGSVLPPTQNRSREAIDRIWLTSGISHKVTKVGILPKDKFLESDHCAIFLDIDKNKALSDENVPLPSHQRRRLKSSDIKACNKYQELLTHQLNQQGILIDLRNFFVLFLLMHPNPK